MAEPHDTTDTRQVYVAAHASKRFLVGSNGRHSAEDSISRRGVGGLDVRPEFSGLQSGSNAKPRTGCRISQGSSVSAARKKRQSNAEFSNKHLKYCRGKAVLK